MALPCIRQIHAFGFATGSCPNSFCGRQEICQSMEGMTYRFFLLFRPSLKAVGIDVFHMFARTGWDSCPVGSSAEAEIGPKGTLAGIVIVQ
jgi:hypothetical protein